MQKILAGLIVTCLSLPLGAQQSVAPKLMGKPEIMEHLPQDPASCAADGIAVGGYDLTSYQLAEGPRFGSAEFPAEFDGLTYLFETEQNRATFLREPDRFLPAYSGWCAVTLALGRLSCPDYDNFKIEDGRLLLFELTGFTNGQTLWNSQPTHYRGLADDNYAIVMEHE